MKNILVAVENCETTTVESPIVQKAIEVANAFSSRVWLLHVVPPSRQPPFNVDSRTTRQETANELRHEHEFLQHLAKCMQDRKVDTTALLVQGTLISTTMKECDRLSIDLVISGCHKHGRLYGALMDNAEESLLSKCARPILFVPC